MTVPPDNPVYKRFSELIQQNVARRRARAERNNRVLLSVARGDEDEFNRIINEPIDEWLKRQFGSGESDQPASGD